MCLTATDRVVLRFVFTKYPPNELHDMNNGQCDGQLRASPRPPNPVAP